MKYGLQLAAAVLALSFAGFSHAEEMTNSEDMHQAEGGKMEVTPGVNYTMATQKAKNGVDYKEELTSTPFSVAGEYGIDQNMSVGLTLGYAMAKDKPTCSVANGPCPSTTSTG